MLVLLFLLLHSFVLETVKISSFSEMWQQRRSIPALLLILYSNDRLKSPPNLICIDPSNESKSLPRRLTSQIELFHENELECRRVLTVREFLSPFVNAKWMVLEARREIYGFLAQDSQLKRAEMDKKKLANLSGFGLLKVER